MSIVIDIDSGRSVELIISRSAYSLSGHVSVSVTSPFSLFEHRRTARLLLQSLVLTFEGQEEVITSEIGYSALRLCRISREIIPYESIELNNEGHEEADEPCKLAPILIYVN